jgi:NAD(P)-dependent dehydrogenase (short-subunit alcohol dehydrogenase family)
VADYASVQNLAQETERAFGPADIVVANASVVAPVDQMWKIDPRDWANIVQVNLTGAFFTARAFLPSMMQRKQGILIFVSSGAATHPVVGWGAYCASKAGLDMLAQTLAAESDTAQAGIRVHALYPGIVDTQMQADIRSASTEQFPQVDRYRAYKEKGRLRSPEEPAQMIWWLSTSLTADYHGQILSLDDPAVRERMARDLSTEPLGGR